MAKITYVFSNGRANKLDSKSETAKEFFYGYFNFLNNGHDLNIIEFNLKTVSKLNFFYLFDRILNKFFSLPSSTHKITSKSNLKLMKSSDLIILVNEKVGFSCFFLLLALKITNNKSKIALFSMGLYSKNIEFKLFVQIHKLFINLLVYLIDSIIFLGEPEYKKAVLQTNRQKHKFHFLPFSIDENFWKMNKKVKKEYILFIGNDGNRDYDMLNSISSLLKNEKFLFISNNEKLRSINKSNVKVLKGDWGKNLLSDIQIRDIYSKAKMTIVPLKNTFQPSGQSVSLQSMSMGVPVVISKTFGFWDEQNFKNEENIIFVNNPKVECWKDSINKLLNEDKLYKQISKNGQNTIKNFYTYEEFFIKLLKIVKI